MVGREQFIENIRISILENSMFVNQDRLINMETALEFYDFLNDNVSTRITVVDRPSFRVNETDFVVMDMKIDSKEDAVDKLNNYNADEIYLFNIGKYMLPSDAERKGEEGKDFEIDIAYIIRFAYRKENEIEPKASTMTLEDYNNLPLRSEIEGSYEGLMKMLDADDNPRVYEVGARAVVLSGTINEDGGMHLAIEMYTII
ncbi:MAG: hypothetical protein KAS32_16755 [Candidatus Peribacteraceae bacterium]|nr:hypothetical protein [Candidatus Peribacteraceae bacterium]